MLTDLLLVFSLWRIVSPQVIMSVDFGSEFIKVGVTKPGLPFETVLNRDSNRKTYNAIGFFGGERYIGDRALTVFRKSPESVIFHPHFLLGKHFNSTATKHYREMWPHVKLEEDERTGTINVRVGSEVFSIMTLVAMQLQDIKFFTNLFARAKVSEVVIAIPAFSDQTFRQFLRKAVSVASLSPNSFVETGFALGIRYAIAKRNSLPTEHQRVMIVDVGSYKTEAHCYECFQVVTDEKKKTSHPVCELKGYGFYMEGVKKLDECIFKIMERKFKESFGLDYSQVSSSRRDFVIREESNTIKHALTGIPKTQFTLEQFYNDRDWYGTVSQVEINDECKNDVLKPLRAIEFAKKSMKEPLKEFDAVVMMGGGSRVPLIQDEMKRLTNVDSLSSVMNTDEDIALGSLFVAAERSKHFRVAQIVCKKRAIYPINAVYTKSSAEEGNMTDKEVYSFMSINDRGKVLTIKNQTVDFDVILQYGELNSDFNSMVLPGSKLISSTKVTGVEEAVQSNEDYRNVDVKIHIVDDEFGLIKIKAAKVILSRSKGGTSTFQKFRSKVTSIFGKKSSGETQENEEFDLDKSPTEQESVFKKVEEYVKKETTVDSSEPKTITTSDGIPVNVSDDAQDMNTTNEGEDKKPKVSTPPETLDISLSLFNVIMHARLPSQDDVDADKEILLKYRRYELDKEKRERVKSDLESMIYDLRDKLSEGRFADYASGEEMEALSEDVESASIWFDELVEDTNTSDIIEAKNNLSKKFQFITDRKNEEALIKEIMNEFYDHESQVDGFISMINENENISALIDEKDLDKLAKDVLSMKENLNVTKKEYETLKPWEDKKYPSLVLEPIMKNIMTLTSKMSNIIINYQTKLEKEKKKEEERLRKEAEKKKKSDASAEKDDEPTTGENIEVPKNDAEEEKAAKKPDEETKLPEFNAEL